MRDLAESRGMTMRAFAERWINWMERLDPSEQAIVLDQISRDDHAAIAAAVLRRNAQGAAISADKLPPPDEFAEYVVSGKRPGQPASAKRKSAG